MDSTSSKLWTFNFVSAWLANFMMGFSFYLLIPTLPFYLVDRFAADKALVGIIMSCYVIAALLIRPFSGYMVDKFDRKSVYIISFVLFVASTAGYFAAISVALMLILRFVQGLTWGVITTAGNTLAVDIMPSAKRGQGIGYFGLSLNLSMAVGPMVGLFMYDHYSFDTIFYTAVVTSAIGLLLAAFIKAPERIHLPHRPISLDHFLLVKAIPVGINLIFISLPYGMVLSFAAMYGKELGVTSTGLFFTLMALGMALSRLFSGKSVDKGQVRQVTVIGSFILIFGFALLTVCLTPLLYYGAAFFIGLGYGVLSPTFQALFINMGTHHQRGTANSTFLTAFDLGVGGGMLLAGKIAAIFTLSTAFGVSTAACVVSLLFFVKITAPYYQKYKVQ